MLGNPQAFVSPRSWTTVRGGSRRSAGDPKDVTAEHALIVEPNDGRTAVLSALGAATTSIDLTIYELSDPAIVSALLDAQRRKVQVRVLYNWYSFPSDVQQAEIVPTIERLTKGGVACKPAPPVFEVTHEKAFVVDGESALVLTFNLASEYFGTTRDFGIQTTVPGEVAEVAAVFEADWNDRPIIPSVPTLVWSPVNSRAKLTELISSAGQTLDVYCEEIDDPGTLGALAAAAKRGVRVRLIAAVLTANGTSNANTQGLTYLNASGVDAVSKSFPISTPTGPAQLYIHAKAIVADYGCGAAQAYVGSENLSCVSLDDNRECGIFVNEPVILDRLEATFSSDWAQPSVPVTPDPTPIPPCAGNPEVRAAARVNARA